MPILTTSTEKAFDKAKIAKGDLIRAKYAGWDEAVNGIVARVEDTEIRVLTSAQSQMSRTTSPSTPTK